MNDENEMSEPTTAEIVETWSAEIEGIWAQITDDTRLTDDQKADLIQTFEDIDGLLDDAKKILKESSEGE
jgi:hypothetical protein